MYIHTDIFSVQTPKKRGQPCGDAMQLHRDSTATTLVLADGLGSGIRANIAATICVSRLIALIENGISIREAFIAMTRTMDKAWGKDQSFAVFTLLRILNNGQASVLTYEMPPPILISPTYAQVLQDRVYTQNKAIIHESNCLLDQKEGILLMSDGISQAGIGKHFPLGWGAEGVRKFIQSQITAEQIDAGLLTRLIHEKARSYWPPDKGDDCSVVMALNRRGVIVNLLSGPPSNKAEDETFVNSFWAKQGIKVIAGGSTAKMAGRVKRIKVDIATAENNITPPAYKIDGIELVTEGMVTLNQVFHLLDEDPENYPARSPASELAYLLKMADRVNIWQGNAENTGAGQIEFKQQGLLKRVKIIQLVADRLRQQGKLVVHERM